MIKNVIKAVSAVIIAAQLSGCMGSMGVSQKVTDLNLKLTDNKYGRAAIYVPAWLVVYPIAGLSDVVIFNSIEFWSGENPITGKPAIIDVPYRNIKK
ncbi:DUF3332 family protein [Endozoicomonas ascidiicola]|uniref:DUF3332 family protein n=1 Tax=Endozoicomonas ascidiicola TaxID=1698521 RepID=UPI00082DDC31|nr:DUF3332 family protein [Endozoicomonas ascidiicola]